VLGGQGSQQDRGPVQAVRSRQGYLAPKHGPAKCCKISVALGDNSSISAAERPQCRFQKLASKRARIGGGSQGDLSGRAMIKRAGLILVPLLAALGAGIVYVSDHYGELIHYAMAGAEFAGLNCPTPPPRAYA